MKELRPRYRFDQKEHLDRIEAALKEAEGEKQAIFDIATVQWLVNVAKRAKLKAGRPTKLPKQMRDSIVAAARKEIAVCRAELKKAKPKDRPQLWYRIREIQKETAADIGWSEDYARDRLRRNK